MLYLLDANVLITAKNQYYEFGRVDQYWEWLAHHAEKGRVKIPEEICEEIASGEDPLVDWLVKNKEILLLKEEVDIELVQQVVNKGYAPDLNSAETEVIGKDPFLIAYAMTDTDARTVVTDERRSNRKRQNRTIPSVCNDLGVKSCNQWDFGRALDFRTNWKRT